MKILIKSGEIVLEDQTMIGDLLIEDEKIVEIAPEILIHERCVDQVIDAKGKVIIPGGIDAHTHFNIDVGVRAVDDFTSGTIAAVFGGTTSIVDHMGFGPAGCDLHHQLHVYEGYTKDQCVADYGFHGVFQHVDDAILSEVPSMMDDGISSFKIYMTYNYKIEDKEALLVLDAMKKEQGLMAVHCENDAVIDYLKTKFLKEGKLEEKYHALSRPNSCEAEAVNRMITLSDTIKDAPLYIVHVSAGESVDLIREAKKEGTMVYGETCPQYLVLDDKMYELPDHGGLKYIMSPPLRKKVDQDKLWEALADGTISVVATDHCTFNFYGDKQNGKDDFTKCPNGGPGVETRVPILYSEGVKKGRLSLNTFANIIATNPAKLFGMYPKKGVIKVGSDADLVMIDPDLEVTLSKSMLHEKVDYSAYEGMKLTGYPVMSMIRGQIVTQGDELKVTPGFGQYIHRDKRIDL